MKSNRREFMKMLGMSTAALSFPIMNTACSRQAKRPNILFIMSDDHAEQAISCYGSQLIQTPHIDRIANEGIRFDHSYVTNSICGPCRAVLLTGKYSHLNGFRDNLDDFDGSQPTFIKMFQKAGYHTGVLGKWHLKSDPTGFDIWKILIDQGEYYNPEFKEMGELKKHEGYATDIITDMALDALEARDPNKPFCFLVHHKAPHRHWQPHLKNLGAFDDRELPLPETFYDDYKGRPAAEEADMRITDMYISRDLKLYKEDYEKETGTGGNADFAKLVEKFWEKDLKRFTPEQREQWDAYYKKVSKEFKEANLSGDELLRWKYQRYVKDYLSCILSVDESIGRILDYLDEKGLAEDTIVVYTSDQGFYLGEHGWYDKRFMYEESFSMPLVMRYPREIKKGQVNENLVMNLDFAPTFLDLAGLKIPNDMQGESLRPLFNGTKVTEWRDSIYYHYYEYPHGWHMVHAHCGVRTDRYKLIHFYDLKHWELYDLKHDPNELKNLYHDEKYQDIVKELKNELTALQTQYKDNDFGKRKVKKQVFEVDSK